MGWERALITDSGGFQVFSLAHGGVADEVKGSGRPGGEHGSVVSIGEEGVRFRSYRDGAELFISPEVSMQVQAALGSDIALVFDECTPYHADRDYTARSMERTHRWLEPLPRLARRRRARSARPSSGSSRAASTRTCGASRRRRSPRRRSTGSRSAAPSAATRRRWRGVLALTAPLLPEEAPKHLLGIGEVDDLLAGIAPRPRRLRLRRADPPRPPRRRPRPRPRDAASASTCARPAGRATASPLVEGCPCPACQHHDRDYLSYLSRAEELTAVRLLCLHNLTYMRELSPAPATAIVAGSFDDYRARILAGATPWDAGRSLSSVRRAAEPRSLTSVFSATASLNSSTTLSTVSPAISLASHAGRLVGGDDHRGGDGGGDQDQGDEREHEAHEAGEGAALRRPRGAPAAAAGPGRCAARAPPGAGSGEGAGRNSVCAGLVEAAGRGLAAE